MKDFIFKKYALTEVVLLAILVVGLIVSHSIVLSRSYIKLSAPYEVPAGGFSFSMPNGAGWQAMPALRFAQNSFYMTAVQNRGGKNATSLTVSYLLAAGKPDANEWLAAKAAQLGENVFEKRIIKGKGVDTHAVMIDLRGQPFNVYYGIASLPGQRSISIELVDTADDPELGWNILNKIAENFAFNGDPLLHEGQKVISSLRSKGLGKMLDPQEQKDYFLINTGGKPEGFAINMYTQSQSQDSLSIKAIDSYTLQHQGGRESVVQTSDRFDKFLILSSALTTAGTRKEIIEVSLDKNSTMSVIQDGGRSVETYLPGPAAIPDVFSDAVFRQMIADGTKQAVIDFISSEGQINPAMVQIKALPSDSNGRSAHVVTIKHFGDVNLSEEIHLDTNGRMTRNVVTNRTTYVIKRETMEMILDEFPLWRDYIMSLDKMLKEDIKDGKQNLRRIVRNAGTII